MSARLSILRKARRRVAIDLSLRFGALGMCAGAGAAAVLVAIDRVFDIMALPWWVYAVVAAVGLIGGLIYAAVRTPAPSRLAVELDAALHLKDRLGTAEAIDRAHMSSHTDRAFAAFAQQDAEQWAARLDVRSATPIRISPMWGGAAAATAALVAALLWLPRISWARQTQPLSPVEQVAFDELRNAAAEELHAALDDLRDGNEESQTQRASEEDISALNALAEQMQRKEQNPDEFTRARDDAAAQLSEFADRFEKNAQRDERVLDDLSEQFSSLVELNPDDGERPTLTDELRDALARGDYERAAEIVEELSRDIDQLPAEDREALADALRELADDLGASEEELGGNDAAEGEALREALRNQGLDEESIDEILNEDRESAAEGDDQSEEDRYDQQEASPENLARELAERGVDEDVARELAEEIEEHREHDAAREEARETARDLSESFERLADEAQDDQNPAQPEERQPETEQSSDVQRRQDVSEQSADERDEQVQTQDANESDGEQTERDDRDATEREADAARRDEGEQQSSDEQRGGEESQPQQSQLPSEQAQESLRRLEERRRGAQESREQAERMRESARRMSEQMTPEERREYERWASEMHKEGRSEERRMAGESDSSPGPPGGLEPGVEPGRESSNPDAQPLAGAEDDVDLRDENADERTIAEWFDDDEQPIEGDPGRTGESGAASPIRAAERAAERAVSGSSVPARYHDLIRRYFDRFEDAVKETAGDERE